MKEILKNKGDNVLIKLEQLKIEAALLKDAYFQLKRTEKELRESEEKFKKLADSITDTFFAFDKNLRYTYWNKASEKLTGVPAEKALGKSLYQLFPRNEETKGAEKFYRKVLRTGKPKTFISQYRLGGKEFFFEISAYPSRDGLSVFVKDITEKKKIEEELRTSEQKYRGIFKSANDLIQRCNPKGVIIEVNDKWLKTLGYSKKVIGKIGLKQVIHPDYWDFCSEKFKEVVSGRSVMNVEAAFITRAGKKIPVEVNATPLFDEKGNFVSTLGIFRDIRQRRKTEEQIRELQEYLQLQIERMPIGLIVWDTEFRAKTWNPSATKIFGFSEKEALGKHPYSLIVPKEAQSRVTKIWSRLLKGDKTAHSVNENITKNGRTIVCRWSNTPLKQSGKVVGVLSMVQDITKRKEAEDELRENEERYRNLIEGSYDMIQSVGPDGRFKFVNKAWHDTLGYTKKELSKLTMFDVIHPDSLKHCQEAFQQIIGGKSLKDIEAKFITKDGRVIFVEGNAFPRYKGGKIIATQGFFRNVTELRKAREKAIHATLLGRQLEQQREIDKMKTEFISIVSHQLRTPLSVIRGNLEMVLDGTFGKITNEQSETLDQAHLGTRRLIRLVNDLLNLSRLEAGRLKIEPEPTQLGDFIKQILGENERLIKEGRCEVIVEEPKPRLPKVSIDPALLRQVVNNLLANAIHYSGKDRCDVHITIKKKAKDYLISIADRGVGIPKDVQSRIFTKFFRAENARRIKVEGSGLGLSIVKMLVEAWGGKIWFESEEGKGTTFYLTIPRGGMKEKKGEKALAEDSM